jgi:hypothetical protein
MARFQWISGRSARSEAVRAAMACLANAVARSGSPRWRAIGVDCRDRRRNVGQDAQLAADRRRERLLGAGGQRALGVGQQRLDLLQPPGDVRLRGHRHAQAWPGADQLGRQGGEPPPHGGGLAAAVQTLDVPLDQPGRPAAVAGGQGMADGIVGQPVPLVPRPRGPVQLDRPVRPLLLEPCAEQGGEQVVVAPPAAHLVQRHQEQVGPLDLLQQPLAVAAAGDGVTQRAAQSLQHRGLQQELAHLLGLAVEHLLGQVVEDVPVAAAEAGHEAGRVGVAA